MIRDWAAYEAYEVTLNKPSTSWLYKGAIYYTVHFHDIHGNLVIMDIKPNFSGETFARSPLDT